MALQLNALLLRGKALIFPPFDIAYCILSLISDF